MAFTVIETKFLPPTNHRGARVKATRMDRWTGEKTPSVTIPYSFGVETLTVEQLHLKAAKMLLPEVVNKYVIDDVILIAGSWERGYIFTPILKKELIGPCKHHVVWDHFEGEKLNA